MSAAGWIIDPDGEHTRRIGPWVLRVWFYDPAVDGTPDAPASWWWSVCLAGMDEVHVGVEGAPETLLRIGGDRCADAADGHQRAMDGLQGWLAMQAGHVETIATNWCAACGASLAFACVASQGRRWCIPCFNGRK